MCQKFKLGETDPAMRRAYFIAQDTNGNLLNTMAEPGGWKTKTKPGQAPVAEPISDPLRGSTPPTATLAPVSPATTEKDDLVIVVTWSQHTAVPTHTLQAGFTSWTSSALNDGATSGRLSVAFITAANSGATTYQAYTSDGTTNYSGIFVLRKNRFTTVKGNAASSDLAGGTPNPPAVTTPGNVNMAFIVITITGWHLSAAADVAVTPPAGFSLGWSVSGSAPTEVALAYKYEGANQSVDPSAWIDNAAETGSASVTLYLKLQGEFTRVGRSQYEHQGLWYWESDANDVSTEGPLVLQIASYSNNLNLRDILVQVEAASAGGTVDANVTQWNGTTVTTNVAGVPRVDLTHVEGVDGAVAAIQSGLATAVAVDALPTAAEIDTQLSGVHGAGSWAGDSAATVADAVWDEARSGHVAAGSFGEYVNANVVSMADGVITAAKVAADVGTEIATAVWDFAVEGVFTAKQLMRGYASALFGKSTGQNTTTRRYRDLADTKDRIVATTDATGRTAITPNLD